MKFVVYIFFVLSTSVFSQGVQFFGEDITFRVDKEYFFVDGIYWFFNETDKPIEKIIYYPFPTDSSVGEVDSVRIYNISELKEKNALKIDSNGLRYLLLIPPNDTIIYRIGYRQKVRNNCVKYILTSTKEWGRSLDWAKYKLIVDNKIEINTLAYYPDRLYTVENEKIYYWEKRNFLPEYDFMFCMKE